MLVGVSEPFVPAVAFEEMVTRLEPPVPAPPLIGLMISGPPKVAGLWMLMYGLPNPCDEVSSSLTVMPPAPEMPPVKLTPLLSALLRVIVPLRTTGLAIVIGAAAVAGAT